ncbi:MAG TPA: arylesterase [Geobacteraceae bacterium]|nr:arylesterase [Geobacteraceae bacterium]
MTTIVRAVLCCLLLAPIPGCQKVPQVSPLPADGVILAFGDSITFGTGANEAESYPALLEKMCGRRVVNAGLPGEVSRDGVQRLAELLDRDKPALVILCHGGNDLLQKLDQAALAENLRSMIRLAREKGIPVVLLAVPAPDLSLKPPGLYAEVAAEFDLPIEMKSLAKILGKGSLKSDYIHPNAAGYRLLAENVLQFLTKCGAIP